MSLPLTLYTDTAALYPCCAPVTTAMLPLLCSALMLGIMIFVGARANRMYLNHCVRTVQEIKSISNTENDLSAEYTARGGVNVVVTFCLLACYMILRWIPLFLT